MWESCEPISTLNLSNRPHCRPDQKSVAKKFVVVLVQRLNQLVWSKNDPWWRPDFFLSTPKLGKASKRPQN